MAHEIGHLQNNKSKNPIKRTINWVANRESFLDNDPVHNQPIKTASGVLGSIRRSEETEATRKGLKLLKEEGATPEELKIAEDSMKNALRHYKHKTKSDQKKALANFLRWTKGERRTYSIKRFSVA